MTQRGLISPSSAPTSPLSRGADAQNRHWETGKDAERAARADCGTLAGIPGGLPALTGAYKLTAHAARVGFDWPDAHAVLDKLNEEIAELHAELRDADPDRLADEVGDLLFVLANLARKLNLDPEECLRRANRKFQQRFQAMEERLQAGGRSLNEYSLERMEAAWQAVKAAGRS